MQDNSCFVIDKNTIVGVPKHMTKPVGHAVEMILRDMEKVFGEKPGVTENGAASVIVEYAGADNTISARQEAFIIHFDKADGNNFVKLHICGSDDLGIIYGLLYISGKYLGFDPFWFWTGIEPPKREWIGIPADDYVSPEHRVRYRGWFVNDEVCLIGWKDVYPPPKEVWYPVFEALLRCGGNMVIPGTDLPRNGIHNQLALDMGLYVTHHHAEPLGAEMFARAYPDEEASYDKNAALFEGLWRSAIEKHKKDKIIWVLGFRGQGDCPFWEQDKTYSTIESRGALISRVIRRQYEMLHEYVENPPCAAYMYGEITELYRQGLIDMPEGIIKIWADNGYGKMVSRRQGNHNPRVSSLPGPDETGMHGLYYHITFHDLQASNHLTMFPSNPKMISGELNKAFHSGADRFLLLNCGNIRPHIILLNMIAELWNKGPGNEEGTPDDICKRYFSTMPETAAGCYAEYFNRTVAYGPNGDDRAGEEYYHHPARSIIGHWMRGETTMPAEDLLWAAGSLAFTEQVNLFYEKTKLAISGWDELEKKCIYAARLLRGSEAVFFRDNILLQVLLHLSGSKGFNLLCKSYFEYRNGNYPLSFVYASQSIIEYKKGLAAMSSAEHGKWKNFYRADWLTNIKSTIYSLEALRKYIRMHGDSPDFFLWYREYIMPENEKKIYLENTHRKPLSDDELAEKLSEKFNVRDAG